MAISQACDGSGDWHRYWAPGQRLAFNQGTPAEEEFFQSPLMSAPQVCQMLASKRFGPVAIRMATQKPNDIRAIAQGLANAGATVSFIDACRAEIVSTTGAASGVIELQVFGGGQPGETWQVENITGFWSPPEHQAVASEAYDLFISTLKAGDRWIEDNADSVLPAITKHTTATINRLDDDDFKRERAARQQSLDTAIKVANTIKQQTRGPG